MGHYDPGMSGSKLGKQPNLTEIPLESSFLPHVDSKKGRVG